MLRRLAARNDSFDLRAPFRISRGIKTRAEVVTVTIAQGGVVGRGEAAPYPRYGETVESVLAQIEGIAARVEAGCDREALRAAMSPGAARNAVDCALWDLEAKSSRTDVATLLGLPAVGAVETAMTISLDTPDNMAEAARGLASVPLLKVKVDRMDVRERIAAVRREAPDPRMIVDPNESWTLTELREVQDFLVEQRVDLIEQPLSASADFELEGFERRIPICADESIHTAADLPALRGRYDAVNIKLDKTGGLTEGLVLAKAARREGFVLMVGCMICSSLGIAPALHIAGAAAFVDLDGPLWLRSDRAGGVIGQDGFLSPPTPGFWGDVAP